jgi:hypothetical protein
MSTSTIDMQTLWLSLRQAEHELNHEKNLSLSTPSTKEILLQKVIKNWKPSKKETVH